MSLAAVLLIVVAGLMAYVRLAPVDAALWHIALASPLPNGADAVIPAANPAETLAQLDTIALATPRTRRIAGSATEGRITWETRSLLWGFPDYTTAQITATGVSLYARQRFGSKDLGVNAARLAAWLAQL